MRITLRPYRMGDREAVGDLCADPETMRFVGDGQPQLFDGKPHLIDRIFEKYRTDPGFHVWAIDEGGAYAGHAELKRREGRNEYELIYILERKRWGRGLGGIVADLILDQARLRDIPSVIATVYEANASSLAILRRRGFVPDARLSKELDTYALRRTAKDDASG
jgi:[ribosomal protein S5]-alanine N-acetyltransferase